MFMIFMFFIVEASSLAATGTISMSVRVGGLMMLVESYISIPPGFTAFSNLSNDG